MDPGWALFAIAGLSAAGTAIGTLLTVTYRMGRKEREETTTLDSMSDHEARITALESFKTSASVTQATLGEAVASLRRETELIAQRVESIYGRVDAIGTRVDSGFDSIRARLEAMMAPRVAAALHRAERDNQAS